MSPSLCRRGRAGYVRLMRGMFHVKQHAADFGVTGWRVLSRTTEPDGADRWCQPRCAHSDPWPVVRRAPVSWMRDPVGELLRAAWSGGRGAVRGSTSVVG